MNLQDRKEWEIAKETALGRSCGSGTPTNEEKILAVMEADEHLKALWKQKNLKKTQPDLL